MCRTSRSSSLGQQQWRRSPTGHLDLSDLPQTKHVPVGQHVLLPRVPVWHVDGRAVEDAAIQAAGIHL